VVTAYGLLVDVDAATPFIKAVNKTKDLRVAYIVTDDERVSGYCAAAAKRC